jgi:hypothetical protein
MAEKRIPYWLGLCVLAALALVLLWQDHESHILRVLPWLILLACPLLHLLMHRGHGQHGQGGRAD